MFIRSVKVRGHTYVRLVESYRENGKVKQRYIGTICSQETFDIPGNGPEAFVDYVADLLMGHTDIGDTYGSKKQTANMMKARAQDLLDEYDRRMQDKERFGKNQAQAPSVIGDGQ